MKNLFSLGVRNSLFVLIIFPLVFTACKGGDTGSGGVNPCNNCGGGNGGGAVATLSIPAAPATPLWNGGTHTFTGISSSNATGITASVNGGPAQTVTNGEFTVSNITEQTTVVFTTTVATGVTSASVSRTINVVKPRLTMLAKDVPAGWLNVARRDSAYGGGTWVTPSNGTFCPRWNFGVDNSCTLMNIEGGCGLPGNSPNYNVLNADETTMTVGQRVHVIVSLTNTRLIIRDYSNSTGVCTEREFIK